MLRFLVIQVPDAVRLAGLASEEQFLLLGTALDIGQPFPEMPELRELVIAFRGSGYVASLIATSLPTMLCMFLPFDTRERWAANEEPAPCACAARLVNTSVRRPMD